MSKKTKKIKRLNAKMNFSTELTEENSSKTVPVIDFVKHGVNCEKLHKSIKDVDEKNIAVSGIYGAGKSTLIKTYKRSYGNKFAKEIINDCNVNDEKSRAETNEKLKSEELKEEQIRQSLTISLASFNIVGKKQLQNAFKENDKDDNKTIDEGNENNNDEKVVKALTEREKIKKDFQELNFYKENRDYINDANSSNLEQNIEKSLLQQFLFSNKQPPFSDSRVKRIVSSTSNKVTALVFFILSLTFLSIYLINWGSLIWSYNQVVSAVFISLISCCSIVFFAMLPFIIKIKGLRIDRVEIEADSNQNGMQESLLSKYIDEIIYFFKTNKIKVVYFEDLDRLPNLNIFNKLRELNFILNNSKEIEKKITFVYCISDSILADCEERSKFFDNIITIEPYVNIENLKKTIDENIKSIKDFNKEDEEKITEYASDMSKFMVDSRLSKYIKKDFLYLVENYKEKNTLTVLEVIKLYTLAIYKNLYYFDYNKLSKQNSCLDKSFQLIRYIKQDNLKINAEELEEKEKQLQLVAKMPSTSLDFLKMFVSGLINVNGNTYNSSGKSVIYINSLTAENFNDKYIFNSNNKYMEYEEILNYFNTYFHVDLKKYIGVLELDMEDAFATLSNEIDRLRNYNMEINAMPIPKFMENYDCSEIDNEFIYLCLKKGYIENDFRKFLYGENHSYLSENDDAFIRYNNMGAINSPIKDNYLYNLNNIGEIINSIYTDKFSTYNILNIPLFNYFMDKTSQPKNNLSLAQNKKFQMLCDLLIKPDTHVHNFYKEYLKTQDDNKCINILKKFYKSSELIPAFISLIGIISLEKQNKILNCLINELDLSLMTYDNKNAVLKIINNYTSWDNIFINKSNIENLLTLGKIEFVNLQSFNLSSLEEIVKQQLFKVNYDNIVVVLQKNYNEQNTAYYLNKIIGIEDKTLYDYFIFYLAQLLKILPEQIVESEKVYKVLKNDKVDTQLKVDFIQTVHFNLDVEDDIDKDMLKIIVDCQKVSFDILQIYRAAVINKNLDFKNYFNKENFNKISFKNLSELEQQEEYEWFIGAIIYPKIISQDNNLDIVQSFNFRGIDLSNVDELYDLQVKRLVEHNYIRFSGENFNALKNCKHSYCELIVKNESAYLELLKNNSLEISSDLMTHIIYSTQNKQICGYLVNTYPEKINFHYYDDKKLCYTDIIKKISEVKISNKKVIDKMLSEKLDIPNINESFIDIIVKNNNIYNDEFELLNILISCDSFFEQLKNQYEISSILPQYIYKAIYMLEDRKVIKTNKRGYKWPKFKITNIINK